MKKSPTQTTEGIASRVKTRRKEKGLTQKQLASKAGMSYGSYKRFEQTGEISLSSLVRIAYALRYEDDFEQLFSQRHYTSIEEIIDGQSK